MKCDHPGGAGNNSWPGHAAGARYSPGAPGDWKQNMLAAIQADAAHDAGKAIHVLPQTTAARCPGSVQAQNQYLVGLVAYANGYHFMRRDEHTHRWSHKNGSIASVSTIAFQARREKCMYIDNDVAADMLANPGNWGETSTFLNFIAYLTVPTAGIQVAG